MTSSRPYLIRALYEWILDNGLTPHLLVDTTKDQVEVPTQFIENNRIILNVDPDAIRDLDLGNDFISFSARFAGKPEHILVAVGAVLAIYARENGDGMAFPEEENNTEPDPGDIDTGKKTPAGKPNLKIVE